MPIRMYTILIGAFFIPVTDAVVLTQKTKRNYNESK
jgi:hypothetical protein